MLFALFTPYAWETNYIFKGELNINIVIRHIDSNVTKANQFFYIDYEQNSRRYVVSLYYLNDI